MTRAYWDRKRKSWSMRWRREHGEKIRHRTPVDAYWHWRTMTIRYPHREYSIYACTWGDWYHDGETARQHYHIGGNRGTERQTS